MYCVCWHNFWVHICSSHVVSRRHCILGSLRHLWLLKPYCLLCCRVCWAKDEVISWTHSIYNRVFHNFSACALRPVSCLLLCSHLLQGKAILTIVEQEAVLHLLSVINNIWTWVVNNKQSFITWISGPKKKKSLAHQKLLQNVNCSFESEQGSVREGDIGAIDLLKDYDTTRPGVCSTT